MLKKLAKTALTTATILAGASVANAASVGSAQLNLGSSGKITVIAEDGKTYSKLQSSNLNFNGNLNVSMNTGRAQAYTVFSGVCGGGLCGTNAFKKLHDGLVDGFTGKMDFNKNLSFDVSTDKFPQGLSNNVQASKIFQACHARMRGGIVKSDKTFTHLVRVTLGLTFSKFPYEFNSSTNYPVDWHDDYSVPVLVTCKALQGPKMPGNVAYDFGDMKVRDIKLFLTTYSHAFSRPNPVTKCKKAKLLVRLKASKKGPVKFKL